MEKETRSHWLWTKEREWSDPPLSKNNFQNNFPTSSFPQNKTLDLQNCKEVNKKFITAVTRNKDGCFEAMRRGGQR